MVRGRQKLCKFHYFAGVRNDISKVLKVFVESRSIRFEVFAQIWRDIKMSLIFAGRESEKELRFFTTEIFKIALEFWNDSASFQNKVGTLYLLYGLYFKQLCIPKCKIRVTLSKWSKIRDLVVELKRQQHLDAEYCFEKLKFTHAFYFVTEPNMENILERHRMEGESTLNEIDRTDTAAIVEERSIISELLEPEKIDQLSSIHEQYHRLKCSISANMSVPDVSLSVIEDSLVQSITKSVATFEEWRKKKASGQNVSRRRRDSGASGTSDSDGESHSEGEWSYPKKKSLLERRQEIREKAFGSVAKSSRKRGPKKKNEKPPTKNKNSRASPIKKKIKSEKTSPESKKDYIKSKESLQEFGAELVVDMPVIETESVKGKKRKKNVTCSPKKRMTKYIERVQKTPEDTPDIETLQQFPDMPELCTDSPERKRQRKSGSPRKLSPKKHVTPTTGKKKKVPTATLR